MTSMFSRFFPRDKPKIKIETTKRDSYSGWIKCSSCEELIHANELKNNEYCCPKCDYHYRLSAAERIASLADAGSFQPLFTEVTSTDPLSFVDLEPYLQRLAEAKEKSNQDEAIVTGRCQLAAIDIALAVMEFGFMGGSMGSVVGERLTRLTELAAAERRPLVVVTSSGGARMQESIYSLMQMAKSSAALGRLSDAGVPYITVLANPTTGGVTASFAALGDLIFAEPKALICFTGPRVIEQTIRQKLPPGFQTSEFFQKHGFIDMVVPRSELKATLGRMVGMFTQPVLEHTPV